MPAARRRPATAPGVGAMAAVLALVTGVAGCSGDDGGDTESFCTGVEENRERILQPEIDSPADAEAHLEMFGRLADEAPLAVEEDWRVVLASFEAANEVEPGDEESEQQAAAAAYAAERSAIFVTQWVSSNCGVELGPVVTVGDAPPPTTTTLPGAPTTTVSG